VRKGWLVSIFMREFVTMNCRRREVPAAAQDSSYAGEKGEKRGAPPSPAVPLAQPQQAGLPLVPC